MNAATSKYAISETEVRKVVTENLEEWGINKTFSQRHRDFHNRTMKVAIENSKQDSSSIPVDEYGFNAIEISSNRGIAIRQVLRNELESSEGFVFSEVHDSLGFGFSPFYFIIDKRRKSRVLVQQNWAKKFNIRQLDPFERFSATEHDAKSHFHRLWSLPSSPMLGGHIFEALVALHMVHNMQCEFCKRRGLSWNGGFGKSASWADVVCKHCMASYEIKSRPSDDKIEKDLKFNSLRGSSFRMFHNNPYRYQARYIVIVSRGETYNNHRALQGLAHRVSVAEIKKVEPMLCGESFCTFINPKDDSRMRMISKVSIDRATLKKAWFFVRPYKEETFGAIACEVFDKVYGDGAWSKCVTKKAADKVNEVKTSNDSGSQKQSLAREIDVEQCRIELDKLKGFKDVWDR